MYLFIVIKEVEDVYNKFKDDFVFIEEFKDLFNIYVGRFFNLYFVKCLIECFGGVKVYLKCEDLNYIGFYKINNVIG